MQQTISKEQQRLFKLNRHFTLDPESSGSSSEDELDQYLNQKQLNNTNKDKNLNQNLFHITKLYFGPYSKEFYLENKLSVEDSRLL